MRRVAILDRTPALADAPTASVAGAVRNGERIWLSAASALQPDGSIRGPGDPVAQAHAAIDAVEAALAEAGATLGGVTKLTTSLVDRGDRAAVYGAIAERLRDVYPVSTGLVVAGLPKPGLLVQIDAEAVATPPAAIRRLRRYDYPDWHGQGFSWQGSMIVAAGSEYFVRGQTGARLDRSGTVGRGRTVADAGEQADLALKNLATLLGEAGGSLEDVAKITVYISDRAYRPAVYPMIGKHFGGVRPVSTGIVTVAFARPEILFEIDVVAPMREGGRAHERIRPYHTGVARYGREAQPLDAELCMTVRSGRRVTLRGQTGVGLDEVMRGLGDPAAQAEQAMDNVEVLLREAGAGLSDVAKAVLYVTDRAFIEPAGRAVLNRLGETCPAFSVLVVKGLASPDLLMEVDVFAALPGPDA